MSESITDSINKKHIMIVPSNKTVEKAEDVLRQRKQDLLAVTMSQLETISSLVEEVEDGEMPEKVKDTILYSLEMSAKMLRDRLQCLIKRADDINVFSVDSDDDEHPMNLISPFTLPSILNVPGVSSNYNEFIDELNKELALLNADQTSTQYISAVVSLQQTAST